MVTVAAHLQPVPHVRADTDRLEMHGGAGRIRGSFSTGVLLDFASPKPSGSHDIALADIQISYAPFATKEAKAGTVPAFEIVGDLIVGEQWRPHSAYLTALAPGVRWNLAVQSPVLPYFQGGAGIALTDIGHPDLGGVFQFTEYLGMGLRWQCRTQLDLFAESRVMHISNAGISEPNHGITGATLHLGIGWSF